MDWTTFRFIIKNHFKLDIEYLYVNNCIGFLTSVYDEIFNINNHPFFLFGDEKE